MTGLNKFENKDRRRQRLRNHVARDLYTPKYKQRIVPDKKRIDNEDGSYYFEDAPYLSDSDIADYD